MEWEGWKKPDEAVTKRWGPAMAYHHGYKWIWLNDRTKDGKDTKIDINTNTNAVFADLRFARDHAAGVH